MSDYRSIEDIKKRFKKYIFHILNLCIFHIL